jgi:hypothetical protein
MRRALEFDPPLQLCSAERRRKKEERDQSGGHPRFDVFPSRHGGRLSTCPPIDRGLIHIPSITSPVQSLAKSPLGF